MLKIISSILLITSLIMLFLSGSLYTTNDWRIFQPPLLIGSTTMIIGLIIIMRIRKITINIKIFIIYILYIITSLISALINKDLEMVTGSFVMLYIFLSLSIVLPNLIKYSNKKLGKDIFWAFLFGHIPILIFPLLIDGYSSSSYSGIFYNPNSLGVIAATFFMVLLSRFLFEIEKYIDNRKIDKKTFILLFSLIIVSILLTIFSSSRTAFLSILVLTLVSSILLLKNVVLEKKISVNRFKRIRSLIFILFLLFCFIYYFTPFETVIEEAIINKFVHKSDNLLDGRIDAWAITIDEAHYFGNGRDFFSGMGLGSHNTFFSILGQYGIVPLLFFIIFLMQVTKKTYKFLVIQNNSEYKYMPFLSILLFVLLSMAEGMMFKTSMLLMFSLIGIMDKGEKEIEK